MSATPNVFPERNHLSNVSFSSLSSEVMYVRIRKMSGEENTPQTASSLQPTPKKTASIKKKHGKHSKNAKTDNRESPPVLPSSLPKKRSHDAHDPSSIPKEKSHDPSTLSKEKSHEPSTLPKEQSHGPSTVPKEQSHAAHDPTPCLKHAAENISQKAGTIPSEKINLCNNCSKSMLSYIFLVQDFLDSLAKEIIGGETSNCLQCARQEMRNNITKFDYHQDTASGESTFQKHTGHKSNVDSTPHKHSDLKSSGSRQKDYTRERRSGDVMFTEKSHHQEPQRKEDHHGSGNATHYSDVNKQKPNQGDFVFSVTPPIDDHMTQQNIFQASEENRAAVEQQNSENVSSHTYPNSEIGGNHDQQWTPSYQNQHAANNQGEWNPPKYDSSDNYTQSSEHKNAHHFHNSQHTNEHGEFRPLGERVQPNYQHPPVIPETHNQSDSNSNFSPSLYREDLDGIISTLSTAEREIYDNARNRAGWESFTESHEKLVVPSGNLITSEAFVTSCRNNAEAMGCLVLGTSLLLCRTSRTLCVLVSEGVSMAFRNAFSSVFQVVQLVRSLDSLGTTKLALLEQPEIGVTFEKLNVWRLAQFTKCVYLNPDTLVIQNCDELFCRDELSAVPDIGWPDCFNSGMFVYCPSVHTFWQLLEFAEKQGSYDGGDQGLLNSYFNSWSSDISKKLSFIYNLMANVSYTYAPAFRQFGRDVKIVQFHGSFKPWHVKFFTKTGQISPSSPVHPTYVQFVHIWINIFRITVLRLLSQEIQSYSASQEVVSAVEMLRFFPLPTELESDFFLTPPSVRLRLAEKKLNRSTSLPISEARRRKSAEVFRHTITEDDIPEIATHEKEKTAECDITDEPKAEAAAPEEPLIKESSEESDSETEVSEDNEDAGNEDESNEDTGIKESKVKKKKGKVRDKNAIPGSEIGDYQGMKAWEQGRMDYEGSARSDNIIKRLEFLMNPKPK